KDDRLKDLFVVLNSSLSGGFNETLTDKVGANVFLSKWHSDELANTIVNRIDEVNKAKEHIA
ncbi:MAG: chemotaxis protein CheV, partial [Thiomicrorhabdus sp.]|nr:chemotaxis protein CheV [Thiomicrorhabdus sp.]